MKSSTPIVKDLVLIGGGHSHGIVLKRFGMNPLPGVRLTLITDVTHTPYSGMLPGYLAGVYTHDQCHIDLRPLTQFAGARFFLDRAVGLDLDNNQVICAHRPPVAFDGLSIDIGSTPNTLTVPGAREHAIPVKPISQFLAYWQQVLAVVERSPHQPCSLSIVGGGAGGVELALAMQTRLQYLYQQLGSSADLVQIHLFQRGKALLPERHPAVGKRLQHLLRERGIQLHLGETVTAVAKNSLCCASGLVLPCDRIFWVTQATAAPWLKETGLALDDQGFIQVDNCLQSVSHAQVFAAGDIATMIHAPRPKAGVFAVRQGLPLSQNLRRALLNQPLRSFTPQREFLILVNTADGAAIASKSWLTLGPSRLLWRWKDWIDRTFMAQFTNLKPMMNQTSATFWETTKLDPTPNSQLPIPNSQPHCAGCGAKVGSAVLVNVLRRLQRDYGQGLIGEDIILGLQEPDDAAVVKIPADRLWVQTIDAFPALVDDAFLAGQITTHHCLSDLFATGADPHSALAIATLPRDLPSKQEETLYQLLAGSLTVLQKAGAVLIGGHTTAGDNLTFGLSCNGLAFPDRLLRKQGMRPGQTLILTKALGTGTLFAADMQGQAKGRWIESAIQSMLRSNQAAAHCLQQHGATACTDVTGFGLLGHLLEMARTAGVAIDLALTQLPLLDGAQTTIQTGFLSSLHDQNANAASAISNLAEVYEHPLFPILFDPQTSGGLLAALPTVQVPDCLAELHALGYLASCRIGEVTEAIQGQRLVQINLDHLQA